MAVMDLSAYLHRIGYVAPVAPDLATLKSLHRAHLLAIPYEGLDVHFGAPLTIDPAAAYAKIVERGRGGWCYEMNGLFGWALEQIGFRVTRLSGGGAEPGKPTEFGNHLVLQVDLDGEPWVADVGFADGPIEPYRLMEGPFEQRGFHFSIERLSADVWRMHNHQFGARPYYDAGPADEAALARRCDVQQNHPESVFRQNVFLFHHGVEGYASVIGRLLREITPLGVTKTLIGDAGEYLVVLETRFDLKEPRAAGLWPAICARHEQLFGDNSQS
jgi:N-hydroxyarylamine O-acetyltransferase